MAHAEDKTILVVDDEPNVRDYLRMILEDAGFNVLIAGDGEEALEIARREKPDFISLDLIMPKMSGHKFLYALKRDKDLSRIPVLVVTAHASDELGKGELQDLLENRMMSGPGTYLEKPVNPRNYIRSIERALGLDESVEAGEKIDLKEELRNRIKGASPQALAEALKALSQSKKD